MTDDQEAKKIPLDKIQIIPDNTDPSALIQYSMQATRQGSGTVSELAKIVLNKVLETDFDIHVAIVTHNQKKILTTLQQYNYTVRIIEFYLEKGQINKDLAAVTINHLINSYEINLESSEKFPGCLLFFGCLLSLVFFAPWLLKNMPDLEIPGYSKNPNTVTQATLQLPLAECSAGSNLPNQRWYPVWVNDTDSATLEHVKKKYCSASFVYNVTSSRQVIQIAGFSELSKAQQLIKVIESDPKINSAEIGVQF